VLECDHVCVAGIDDWDRVALKVLEEQDGASAPELASHVKEEQFDRPMARAWVKDALSRGLVREGEGAPTRYVLTEKGRARLQ
jgi:hypothetical protein